MPSASMKNLRMKLKKYDDGLWCERINAKINSCQIILLDDRRRTDRRMTKYDDGQSNITNSTQGYYPHLIVTNEKVLVSIGVPT